MRALTWSALFALVTKLAICQPSVAAADESAAGWHVGLAKIDITPKTPIRLNGFGFRRTESEGVRERIWARAIAFDDGAGEPALLIAVDILGIPADIWAEVARRLEKKAGLKAGRLAITATHTHTGPMLRGANTTLFGVPIPKEHLEHIGQYTDAFLDQLEKVGLEALGKRKPARLSWGMGKVGFAANRRTKGGPVDHDLPMLVVRDPQGKLQAVYVSYACHCVTLSDNTISGDWAGYAAQAIEKDVLGAMALVSIGCGADANPSSGVTGAKGDIAARQGKEIADEVRRMLGGFLAPVAGTLETRLKQLELPLAKLPTKEEWEARAQRKDAVGHHARVQLEKLARNEALPTKIDYSIQSWLLGDALAMVFLPGEVVVDYALGLKRELDGRRLWINAYANEAPCYIPSERVLREGGYEGGDAMIYYDIPARFKPGLEQPIIDTVREQLGKRFTPPFDAKKTQGSLPLSPQQSASAFRTHENLQVDLVAAEPWVTSPVAIDFGPDGRLWIAEMVDYPSGKQGKFEPGGRVRVLESDNGVFTRATVFLDNIPFPTGIKVWRKGVLICAAPDILYAEDTRRDGKADVVRKLYSGFGTHNYQARVNSLEFGLDGWVYGSCGLFGGDITSFNGTTLALGDRDFRIKPDTGAIEAATGRTQQGRVRDDWDNWFGCDNSNLCRHYILAEHYLRRNPHTAPPGTAFHVNDYAGANRLYPAKQDLQMFKLSGPAFHTTAACGIGVYRDDLLGPEFTGNTFTCEPVNLAVHRLQLSPHGSTFSGRRPADEAHSEFLSSLDNWSRPVQVGTGPDGALWVVDMYRFVIEHPRWIPPADLAQVDVRAGHSMGRIYRVRPKDKEPRPWLRLDKLDSAGLVAALDSPNGWQRDMAAQMLLWSPSKQALKALEDLLLQSQRPQSRLHALCVLGNLHELRPDLLHKALTDAHPGVRRQALRLAEDFFAKQPELGRAALELARDPDAQVRLQLACSLGAWHDSRPARALAQLALDHRDDPYLTAAVLSSIDDGNVGEVVRHVLSAPAPPEKLAQQLLGLATVLDGGKELPALLKKVTQPKNGDFAPWQLAALAGVLDALDRRGQSLEAATKEVQGVGALLDFARRTALDEKTLEPGRLAAIALLARSSTSKAGDLALLKSILVPQSPPTLQVAAITALGRTADQRIPGLVLADWGSHTPPLKSQILDLLLSRPEWQRQLLIAVQKSQVPAGQIDAARRQRLQSLKEPASHALAAKIFADAGTPDRQKVLKSYADATTLPGDRRRGKVVFAKSCAACHQLDGAGHAVGPDLAQVANKSPLYLLTEILDPNRNVDTRYIEYQAILKNGRVVSGLLAAETAASVTLRGQEAKEEVVLRADIEELHSTGKSLMPEGLEKDLPRQAMADVIAYLTGSGR
jgi:putative membrane-bound dehydrogenase-like protein